MLAFWEGRLAGDGGKGRNRRKKVQGKKQDGLRKVLNCICIRQQGKKQKKKVVSLLEECRLMKTPERVGKKRKNV